MIEISRGSDYARGTWKPGTTLDGETVAQVTCPKCHETQVDGERHLAIHLIGKVPESGIVQLECTCGFTEKAKLIGWADRPERR